MLAVVPEPAVKSLEDKLTVTVVALATSLLLYVPLVLVTVKLSLPIKPDKLKFEEVSVAVVLASYVLVGSPVMETVTVLAVMWPEPLALEGKL